MKLDPETQMVATLGSKEGFANMAQAITAPGDVILVPNPTYPIHEFGFIISGAAIRHLPAGNGEEFLRLVDHAVPPLDPEAAGARADLSVEPDGDDGRPRLLCRAVDLA